MVDDIFFDSLVFRKADFLDLPHILSLLFEDELASQRESFPSDPAYLKAFERIIADPNHRLSVVESQGEILGTCHLIMMPSLTFQGGTRCCVEAVRVARAYRGQKIGHWMFAQVIAWGKENNILILQLTTDKKRPDAKRFYEHLGFEASHEGMKKYL